MVVLHCLGLLTTGDRAGVLERYDKAVGRVGHKMYSRESFATVRRREEDESDGEGLLVPPKSGFAKSQEPSKRISLIPNYYYCLLVSHCYLRKRKRPNSGQDRRHVGFREASNHLAKAPG